MRNLVRLSLFLVYTYIIANSLSLAILAIFYEDIPIDYYHWYRGLFGEPPKGFREEDLIDVITQFGVFTLFSARAHGLIHLLLIVMVLLYNIAVLAYPVILWWRKKTVFHAWLVAMAGCLMPPYLYYLFFGNADYIAYGLLLMTVWYALAWFMVPPDRRFR